MSLDITSTYTHSIKRVLLFLIVLIVTVSSVVGVYSMLFERHSSVSALNCSQINDPLPSWLISGVERNKSAYINASNATNVPWEMLAAIHYRETNFSRVNPANGQGIFQFVNKEGGPYPYNGPSSEVSEQEFTRQLQFMANKIQNDYVYRGSLNYTKRPLAKNETEIYRIKDTLFSYNGRSSQYAQQASTYGFNSTTQPYEGSPYVMNRFDCKRFSMGIITRDFGSIDGKDTRYGAFTLYARLKGDAYWRSIVTENLPGCTAATRTNVVCVWQLVNLSSGETAITPDNSHRDKLVTEGWQFQNIAFHAITKAAPNQKNIPIYGLTKPSGVPFITADSNEYNSLKAAGWPDLGIVFYADPMWSNSGYPVWRLHKNGQHKWVSKQEDINALVKSGYQKEGVSFAAVSPLVREAASTNGQQLVYRFSGMPGNTHFWTKDLYERDSMIRSGYKYEGVAWNVTSNTTNKPIYRLYSSGLKRHLYTTDTNEAGALTRTGLWKQEGVAWHGNTTGSPVYRIYAPSTKSHLYTRDLNEKNFWVKSGVFLDEGVAWYQP